MKKILKIISGLIITNISIINVNGCDIFHYSPVDYQQVLTKAANLIANNNVPNFNVFLKIDKNKTHVADFQELIETNIKKLFAQADPLFSNLTYDVINGNEAVKDRTIIKIHLAVANNSAVKDCQFTAKFIPLQYYVDGILKPYVEGKSYFQIKKNDTAEFYQQLKTAGATFKREDKPGQEQYLKNSSSPANSFWAKFQDWKSKDSLLGNVLYPLLSLINNDHAPATGLTFDNFKPYLMNIDKETNVIAVNGNKQFDDNNYYDYIKIGLKGQNSAKAALENEYQGLTFVFIN